MRNKCDILPLLYLIQKSHRVYFEQRGYVVSSSLRKCIRISIKKEVAVGKCKKSNGAFMIFNESLLRLIQSCYRWTRVINSVSSIEIASFE